MRTVARQVRNARISLVFCAFALSTVCVAQDGSDPADETDVYVEYTQSPDTVVVEYDRDVGIEDHDGQPLLRVYGDGRVHVHYPDYMRKAGDYELYLSEKSLSNLLAFMVEKGFVSFDESEVRSLVRVEARSKVQTALAAGGVDSDRSDPTLTTIGLRLSEFQASADKANVPPDLHKVVSWPDIQLQAKDMSHVAALTDLAEVDARLRELLNHAELKRIED